LGVHELSLSSGVIRFNARSHLETYAVEDCVIPLKRVVQSCSLAVRSCHESRHHLASTQLLVLSCVFDLCSVGSHAHLDHCCPLFRKHKLSTLTLLHQSSYSPPPTPSMGVQGLLFMVSVGFNAAASVRVGNELGAGNPKAAAFSVWMVTIVSFIIESSIFAYCCQDMTFLAISTQQEDSREKGVEGTAKEDIHKRKIEFDESGKVIVEQILKHEPCLISLDVEGFYDRDIDSMKYAAKIELFLPNKSDDEIVEGSVIMSRTMYAHLMQQTFQAPKGYPMLPRSGSGYPAAELGMKIACGFEMIYQTRKQEGIEGKGSKCEVYRESLERSGYFEGLLPGSKEYKILMENAQDYQRKSSLHSRESEIMSDPVRRIGDILSNPDTADEFKGQELSTSDDDSWMYNVQCKYNSS
ncbi:protein ecdysoneless, partial [Tanacetum coccineum]